MTVTHPFSPFYGKSFTVIKKTRNGGKDRLICLDDAGNIRWFLADWTNYHDNGPNETTIKGAHSSCGDFRLAELEMLSKLLNDLGEV